MPDYCGCCFWSANAWQYLPQVSLQAHATILSSAARTTLTQTFVNPSKALVQEVSYTFPLYDGVSVVGFECRVGSRLLHSKVKTKEQANADYQDAVANQQTAAIMDHSSSENDVFVIRLGNVPAKETITVKITFIGELKQDAQNDGIRYTLPNSIAPRYGNLVSQAHDSFFSSGGGLPANLQGISITVDVLMEKTSIIREIQSPSHPIKFSLGRISSTSIDSSSSFEPSRASATLQLAKENHVLLERDFVLIVKADGLDNPCALLEIHPTIAGQRALMATLVPKFNLPPAQPEVVFVIDRSGSMRDKIPTLKAALQIFLKSLPVGICFNICSFGSHHSFLWPTSRVYDASSLNDALSFVSTVDSNMGGTEMQRAVVATVTNRLRNRDLEVLILTDGQIFSQDDLFSFVRTSAADNTARFFSLAIGDAASHSLVEGIARSGNGFSQSVLEYEDLDRKVVRMLKGALTPHIYDYKLEVQYDGKADDDFEVLETDETMAGSETEVEEAPETPKAAATQQHISLFDANFQESDAELQSCQQANDQGLPSISPPRTLQAPYQIRSLYPFIRTSVYLLLDPRSSDRAPRSLTLRASSKWGSLELQIPIGDSVRGETIHQLASRKAMIELEEKHGWLEDACDDNGNSFKQLHVHTQQRIVARDLGKRCHNGALRDTEAQGDRSRNSATLLPRAIRGSRQASHTWAEPKLRTDAHDEVVLQFCSTECVRLQRWSMYATKYATSWGIRIWSCSAKRTSRFPRDFVVWRIECEGKAVYGLHTKSARINGPFPGSLCPSPTLNNIWWRTFIRGAVWFVRSTSHRELLFGSTGHGSTPLFGGAARGPAPARLSAETSPFARQEHDKGGFTSTTTQPSKVHALVALQTFQGNWEWNQALFDVLGLNMAEIQAKILHLVQVDTLHIEAVKSVATLLAMGFLVNKNSDSQSVWELVYGKAETWISNTLPGLGFLGHSIETMKTDIMALV
ncbi:uncharacterized protein N7482_008209 [Penicillium canariense]|uniref:von Willebrand domain-containing protein n=1 Tax=Penicillium canariense TaxID=189055 RepID=A0A9W9LI53_9EURO|nr:uncharacterized protein N7482_008209 [Penicillium canariense]KAJ5157109.1 hypothetical protein N7482_008209 [Penicillium canariense]